MSPCERARKQAKKIIGTFTEVFVDCPIEICRARDPKGLYRRASEGTVADLSGVDGRYDRPQSPDVHLRTDGCSVQECVDAVLKYMGVPEQRLSLFIGRYSPFHNGHRHMVDAELARGKHVAIGVRATPISAENPWSAGDRVSMIRAVYPRQRVWVFVLPDIGTVNVGRQAGYDVVKHELAPAIEQISGSKIRAMIKTGDVSWVDLVPQPVAAIVAGLGSRSGEP